MSLCALPDWELRLIAFARTALGKPFAWGETNCVALALRALDAQCGSDLIGRYARRMSSEHRARAWVARHGLVGLADRLQEEGCVVIETAFIQVGDIALAEMPDTIGAAVCLGRTMLSATAAGGVAQFRPEQLQAPAVVLGVR